MITIIILNHRVDQLLLETGPTTEPHRADFPQWALQKE